MNFSALYINKFGKLFQINFPNDIKGITESCGKYGYLTYGNEDIIKKINSEYIKKIFPHFTNNQIYNYLKTLKEY